MVLFVKIFDFAIVMLVLTTKRCDDLTLGFDLCLQIGIGLLDQKYFLLLGKLLCEQLFFFLLLFL